MELSAIQKIRHRDAVARARVENTPVPRCYESGCDCSGASDSRPVVLLNPYRLGKALWGTVGPAQYPFGSRCRALVQGAKGLCLVDFESIEEARAIMAAWNDIQRVPTAWRSE